MSRFQRILIVDDNPTNLAILTEMLEGDFTLRAVRGGEEALSIAERFNPGVILLDVMMPGLDGYETCRRLRMMPALSDAVIIMLSAKAMPSEQAAGMAAGADDYVTKPFDDGELMAKIHAFTQRECPVERLPARRTAASHRWKTSMSPDVIHDRPARP